MCLRKLPTYPSPSPFALFSFKPLEGVYSELSVYYFEITIDSFPFVILEQRIQVLFKEVSTA